MNLKGKKIGFVLTGSFSSFNTILSKIKDLINLGSDIIPIMSFNSYNLNTKYGDSKTYIDKIESITNRKTIHTIEDAQNISKTENIDILIVAPCSANTISKLAYDICDTPTTVAVKFHLRLNLPVVIAISSVDGLGSNAESLGKLLNRKNYYFVPFMQDNPITKPTSLVFDSSLLIKTIEYALENEQIQPILR